LGCRYICIGDWVWLDYNGNGIQDNNANEVGIEGAVVTLLDDQGNTVVDISGNDVASQTTKADGKYQFCNLKPGKYKVRVEKNDPIYFVTYKDKGNNEAKDSDIDATSHTTEPVTLHSGDDYKDLDAGFFKCGSLVGVYSVINNGMMANGVSNQLLDGLLVTIYDEDGNVVQELTTDENGRFKADNLLPGKYKIVFQKPEGMKFAKDRVIYITVRAGDANIKVNNTVTPDYSDEKFMKKVLNKKQ